MFSWFNKNQSASAKPRVEPQIGNLIEVGDVPSSDRIKMFEIFGDGHTAAGARVTPLTAMQVAAAYACTALISGSIGQMPLAVYERKGSSRVEVDHDLWWILNEEPCSAWEGSAFWEFGSASVLLRGDSLAYIQRNRAGTVTGLVPYRRDQVVIETVPSFDPRQPRRLQYFFSGPDGFFGADQDDVIHLPGFGFNGIHSHSVIQQGARNGIGIALRADEFAGKFYSQGAQPQFAITTDAAMTPGQQDTLRDSWARKYSGSGVNGIPLILTEGLKVEQLSLSASDAQLMEARQWQVSDIARAFGVPPVMIGESSKTSSFGAGVEQQAIWFVKHTLGPHLSRFQGELNRKLFRTAKYFVEFNVDDLLAGDSAAQAAYFSKALGGPGTQGWMAVNEVRRTKNLPPLKGYDDVFKSGSTPPANPPKPDDDPGGPKPPAQESDDDNA